MKSRANTKLGHVGSKTRSVGQIFEKPCVCSRDHIFGLILMKFGQSVFVSMICCTFFKTGHVKSKSRSLGQIIKDAMLVTKGLWFKSMLFNAIPHIPVSSGKPLWPSCFLFLAHLSTTCSRGAFRLVQCSLCDVNNFVCVCVCARARACVCAHTHTHTDTSYLSHTH